MALITCPECGRERVSSTALACPECGFAIREYFENNTLVQPSVEIVDVRERVDSILRVTDPDRESKILELANSYNHAYAWYNLGVIKQKQRKNVEAYDLYTKAKMSTDGLDNDLKGRICTEIGALAYDFVLNGDATYAIIAINNSKIGLESDNAKAYLTLGKIYDSSIVCTAFYNVKDDGTALGMYRKSVELNTTSKGEAFKGMSSVELKRKNYLKSYAYSVLASKNGFSKDNVVIKNNSDALSMMDYLSKSLIVEACKTIVNLDDADMAVEKAMRAKDKAINTVKCPKCSSTSISTTARGVNNFWGAVGASQTVNRCARCGYSWKP